MTDEAKRCVEALRWSHLHDGCSDKAYICPVVHGCARSDRNLCDPAVAANLIESLSAELEATEAIAALARGLEVERDQLKARLEHVEYERDAAVECSACYVCTKKRALTRNRARVVRMHQRVIDIQTGNGAA